ncbi:IclR family transcriptional regulator [Bacilliculturomica massiliensis]|uniref:IclR family transcriptional regulator n=1 Tax=Bacilliculturomica massiliensis TaxID=1917867 RepID=UPI0010311952|nr:IclR family transcriptional regulator [Bacilliculturomica massiliensis]
MEKGSETIHSIERALDILILLSKEECEMGVLEIAKATGVYQSTIHRTMATLIKKGFVYQNPDNSKYGLSIKLYHIGMVAKHAFSWLDVAKPFMVRLAKECNETVNLSIMDHSEKEKLNCILLYQESVAKRVLGSSQILGESTPCYCSGVGKVLLAFSEEDLTCRIRAQEFAAYTKNTLKDADELMENLARIREQGYALDEEERELGLFCVACPIPDRRGGAVAALSISGLKSRILSAGVENLIESLKKTADEIAASLLGA